MSAKLRVERIQLASRRRVISAADRERERDREQDVARVEHRRVDDHVGVAQQRRQPGALDRRRVELGERRRREQHQPDEEGADAHQHRGRPGHELAVAAAGQVEDAARGERQHPGPEQQRALLARPHRGQLVEGRAWSSRSGSRPRSKEKSSPRKADLDDHHRRGQQRRQRVDGAARGVDPAAVAADGRRRSRRRRRTAATSSDGGEQRGAEVDHRWPGRVTPR